MSFFNDPTSCNDLKLTFIIIMALVLTTFTWLLDRGNTAIAINKVSQDASLTLRNHSQKQKVLIKSLTLQLGTLQNDIKQLNEKFSHSLEQSTKSFDIERGQLNQKLANSLQVVTQKTASLNLIKQSFEHEKQQLNKQIQELKNHLQEKFQVIENYSITQNNNSLKMNQTEQNLKESRQLSEQQFNEYNQLKSQFSQVQLEADSRLKAINKWQQEVAALKKQLADTKIKIIKSKQRFTVFEMEQDILFDKGQTQLNIEGQKALTRLANIFRQYPNRQIAIQGHSDAQALGAKLKQKYISNWGLAAARAASAIHYLQYKEGITPERIMLVSYAHYRPKNNGKKDNDLAENRRIEITLMPEKFDLITGKYRIK